MPPDLASPSPEVLEAFSFFPCLFTDLKRRLYLFPTPLYLCDVWHAAGAASGAGRADRRRDEDTRIFSSVSADILCDAGKKKWKFADCTWLSEQLRFTQV